MQTVTYNNEDRNTSGLMRHLSRKHQITVQSVRKRTNDGKSLGFVSLAHSSESDLDDDLCDSGSATASNTSATSSSMGMALPSSSKSRRTNNQSGNLTQSSTLQMFKSQEPLKKTSKRWSDITKHIALFIAKDTRPVNIVEGDGFRELIQFLEPRYEMASRPTVDKQLDELYNTSRRIVRDRVKSAEAISLTTDGWTSRSNHSFITVMLSLYG